MFKSNSYSQSNTTNVFQDIINTANKIENDYGNADSATKLAKGLDTICPSAAQIKKNEEKGMKAADTWKEAKRTFNIYDSNENTKIKADDAQGIEREIKRDHVQKLYMYYEYIQFKKATFKCVDVKYDTATGRVQEMDFEFTGNLY